MLAKKKNQSSLGVSDVLMNGQAAETQQFMYYLLISYRLYIVKILFSDNKR